MENTKILAELAGVILASFAFAALVEWICLLGVMRWMPAPVKHAPEPPRDLLRAQRPGLDR